jgi:ribosomal protein S18 acetylase RimI-like enzyme
VSNPKAKAPAKIRRARLADAAALLQLMKPFNLAEEIPWRPRRVRVALRRLLRDVRLGIVLVAEARDRALVGYVVATFNYDLEFAGPDAFVTELFVRPAARRDGLGTRLLEAAISSLRAAGAAAVHLLVRPENRSARSLYAGLGFEEVPRLMMTRQL